MKLSDVINSIDVKSVVGSLDTEITSIFIDSRKVESGSAFCAVKGVDVDGHDFIQNAINAGAVAIISEDPAPENCNVCWVHVRVSRAATALAAANFYRNPSREMSLIGITGTNGKTTTAYLVHHLLQCSLRQAGLIGTIDYLIGDEAFPSPHTTPESIELQGLLREMRDADCRAAVMEVSSHGLAQHRVAGVSFDVGLFTNLSQDHLDYHGDMKTYFQSKRLLFQQMNDDHESPGGTMVVNADDRWGRILLKERFDKLKTVSFGESVSSDLRVSNIIYGLNGTRFELAYKKRKFLVKIPLIGKFNVFNAVAALAAADAIDLNLREAIRNIESGPQIPGRLELVGDKQTNYRVFVDYAHTPDALENALITLRALSPRRIITVFGCGGDRDQSKRPLMAAVADELSDYTFLTSDNPRSEDPGSILRRAESGIASADYALVEDRREAIEAAIEMAGEKDIVLIAGKGHESYQEIDGVRHDFDDRLVARQCINAKAESGELL